MQEMLWHIKQIELALKASKKENLQAETDTTTVMVPKNRYKQIKQNREVIKRMHVKAK